MTGHPDGRLVDILHHGVVRLVPKGGRVDRIVAVPMRTPARVRDVDPAEIPRSFTLNSSGHFHGFHRFGGGSWLRIDGWRFGHAPTGPGAEGVIAFLEGRADASALGESDLGMALASTPLARAHLPVVSPDEVDAARAILDDAREECSAAAARWASDRIVTAGGDAYVRSWQPMAILGEDGRSASLQRCLVEPFPAHWRASTYRAAKPRYLASELQGIPAGLDALPRTQAMLDRLHLIHDERRQAETVRSKRIPAGIPGDDDIVLMANVLPGAVLEQARADLRTLHAGERATAMAAMMAALMPFELRGAAGLLGPDDAEAALAVTADLCALAMATPGIPRQPRYDAVATWAAEVALPRLRDAGMPGPFDPDDEEVLDGLRGPGL